MLWIDTKLDAVGAESTDQAASNRDAAGKIALQKRRTDYCPNSVLVALTSTFLS